MARREALWLLCLLNLSLTSEILAAQEASSSSWSSILQLLRKRPWAENGDEEELGMAREMNLKNYCESWRLNVELHNIRGFYSVPDECASFVARYMSSSQYKSDVHRAADEASMFFSNSFSPGGDGRDAWLFDVDDALLSTFPFYKQQQFGSDATNRTLVEEWMAKSKAPAIEGALKLFHHIRERGVSIFLVSWRPEKLRSATTDNLIQAGYHGWTQLILRCDEEGYAGAQNYSSEQRKKLVRRGYRLWGNVAAQWSGLIGYPEAMRSFKLPNPMYYL